METTPLTKICTGCQEVKSLDLFGNSSRDGKKSQCKSCVSEATAKWKAANPDKVKIAKRRQYLNKLAKQGKAPHVKKPPYQKKRTGPKQDPKHRSARRKSAIMRARPKALTKEQRSAIRRIYDASQKTTKLTGIQHHVDHIIPLNHPDVCGLHVPWNLQILPASENKKKSNDFSN